MPAATATSASPSIREPCRNACASFSIAAHALRPPWYSRHEVICPNCAAPLTGAPPLCPRCGHPILEDDRTIRLSFDGDAVEALGWFLLFILSAIVVIPL